MQERRQEMRSGLWDRERGRAKGATWSPSEERNSIGLHFPAALAARCEPVTKFTSRGHKQM